MLPVSPKQLVADYIDRVWNSGDAAALESLTTPDFRYHLAEQPPLDRAGMRQLLASTRAAFPDWQVQAEEVVAESEFVAVRWSGTATHSGPFHGIPPTGRRIRVSGINVFRTHDGKIAEEWEQTDTIGMLRQMGALAGR